MVVAGPHSSRWVEARPFYFVHPIGGNVLNFSGFASHFDADQPVYGLQARGLDGKTAPNTSVAQMAVDYIADIRSVQPEGPYYIGGFSAGGWWPMRWPGSFAPRDNGWLFWRYSIRR